MRRNLVTAGDPGSTSNDKGYMKRIIDFVKAHPGSAKLVFYTAMAIGVFLVARSEFSNISGPQMRSLLEETEPLFFVEIAILGALAFTATGVYDIFASKHFGVELPARTAMKIGWIAQAFNNFAGLGGLTGGTIRTKYYRKAGADQKTSLNVSLAVWASNLIGLFVMLFATLPWAFEYGGGLWLVPLIMSLYVPLYFLGGRIKWGKLDLTRSPFALQTFRQKLEMTGASLLDWLVAGIFFWMCVRLFIDDVSLWMALFVYAAATLIGLVSFIPGGLGTFDLTCIALFTTIGYETNGLVLAIIVYRVSYYFVPWVLAVLYASLEFITPKLGLSERRQREDLVVFILWIGILVCGIVLVITAITPGVLTRIEIFREFAPRSVHLASKMTMLLVGIMLILLSQGIRARVARVYAICLVLLVVGAFASLAKGFNIEETLLLLFVAILLYIARDCFTREPIRLTWKSFAVSFFVAVGIPVAIFVWRTYRGPYIDHPYPYHGGLPRHLIFYGVLVSLISLALLFSRSRALENFVPPTREDTARFEEFLERYSGNEYSHLFFLGDKTVFYSKDGRVALMYRPHKNNLIILGDPIGDEDGFEAAIDEFVQRAEERKMNVAIYELSAKYLATCADHGFTFVKIGEDASLRLANYSNVGNKGKIFRRMRNRMGEKGTHFEMVEPPFTDKFIAEVKAVSDAWLGDREEMGFSLGHFDVDYLSRAPIAVVRNDERVEGFASIMPAGPNIASVDLMRIRPDAPGGTMDGIFVSLIEWAREQGYEFYNLGMAPLSNTGMATYSNTKQKMVRYIYDFGNRIYNFKGLRSYKEKFRPEWTSRYLVYRNARVLVSTLLSVLDIIHRPTPSNTIAMRDVLADKHRAQADLLSSGLGMEVKNPKPSQRRPTPEGPRTGEGPRNARKPQ
ncbi:MAG: bifunctional lysylphosphatidylglycerol flippase/synthetase MprF [Actinomycetaceae bacterium]|nr:bifunctional lysylphosphatidylglycerol flippase/synthetase MprF [Actinomycetaceae bacterium]